MLPAFIGAIVALAFGSSGTSRTELRLVLFGIFMVPVTIALVVGIHYLAYILTMLVGGDSLFYPMMLVVAIVIAAYALLRIPHLIAEQLAKKRVA